MNGLVSVTNDWVSMILEARRRILGFVAETPITEAFDERFRFGSARLFLKLEHLQNTGSFKLRGAANRVFALNRNEASLGVVTASAGNHGIAVAAAGRHRRISVEVYVSDEVAPEKRSRIEGYGARLRLLGSDHLETEIAARAAAVDSGRIYISPYNDPLVISGQGTIARELNLQLDSFDVVYAAVGGGGLVAGLGAYLKSITPGVEIVGCWAENARTLYECLNAGCIRGFPEAPTLSESTAGGIEPNAITFDLCRHLLDRKVLVSEPEILESMRWARRRGWPIEGAAAVALAAFFKDLEQLQGKTAVVVCCGGNLSSEVARRLQ